MDIYYFFWIFSFCRFEEPSCLWHEPGADGEFGCWGFSSSNGLHLLFFSGLWFESCVSYTK